MSIPYNVTSIGISEKLIENFKVYYIEKEQLDKFNKGEITLDNIILETNKSLEVKSKKIENNRKNNPENGEAYNN